VTLGCYLPYVVFDAWWYLRFVLPAVAVVLTLTAVAGVRLIDRMPAAWRAPAFVLACGAVAVTSITLAARRQVFDLSRLTLVWVEVDPASLDRALDYLRSRGYRPYLLFETWEEPVFRKRFEGKSAVGRLDWPPIAEIDREVRIYDPADQGPYLRGASIHTDRVWMARR
jgi:hypothetical protein